MNLKPECSPILDSALGQDLDREDCKVLITVMGTRELRDGEILVREGDSDNTLFILIKGKVTVNSTINGKDTTVYTMKVGECAGTRAFVDLATRQATLRSVGESVVYTLTPQNFESLLESHPRVVYRFMRGLFRLTHANLMRMNAESQQLSNYIQRSRGRY